MYPRFLTLILPFGLLWSPANGQEPSSGVVYFPILVNGMVDGSSHYQSVFRFLETSGTTLYPAVSVDLDLFDNTGERILPDRTFCPPPIPAIDPSVAFDLAGFGSRHLGTKGFIQAYEPEVGVLDGWARVRWSGPGNLAVTMELLAVEEAPSGCPAVICRRPSTAYRSDALLEPVWPAPEFHAAVVISEHRQAAFSVLNPAPSSTARVFVELYDASGALVRRGEEVEIPPQHRVSRFALEFTTISSGSSTGEGDFPGPEGFYGSARLVSDIPVVVGGLQVLLPEGKLIPLSVAPPFPVVGAICPNPSGTP